ncbi:hypothetical protein BD560DRAFT_429727 [Blakeslea trispora]|nr:hypothetical protein BD560DRAFT_429727 [Blakeslea trispora]
MVYSPTTVLTIISWILYVAFLISLKHQSLLLNYPFKEDFVFIWLYALIFIVFFTDLITPLEFYPVIVVSRQLFLWFLPVLVAKLQLAFASVPASPSIFSCHFHQAFKGFIYQIFCLSL